MLWLAILLTIFLLFGLTAFRGAPYVPAHQHDIAIALDLLKLRPGQIVVDFGSGDGAFLMAAARKGLVAYGYEINPLLCLVARLRCRRYGKQVKILWRDFWLANLPLEVDAIFVFAAGPFMAGLARKIGALTAQRTRPLLVVSYGFVLPGQKEVLSQAGMHLYRYDPGL